MRLGFAAQTWAWADAEIASAASAHAFTAWKPMSGYYRTLSDVVLMGAHKDYLVTRCFIAVGPRYPSAIRPKTGGKNHEKHFESGVAGWAGAIGDRCAS